jgi:hypothetical protein
MSRFGFRALAGRQVGSAPYGGRRGQDLVVPLISSINSTNPFSMTGGGGAQAGPFVTLTANSSAHTFGAWVQIVASTDDESCAIMYGVTGVAASATNTASVVDIGVGPAGSEVSLMQIPVGAHTQYAAIIPIKIPKGSRVSARLQSIVTGGKTCQFYFAVCPVVGDFVSAPTVDVYGTNLATSTGVTINAQNSWVEVSSATTQAYRGMCAVFSSTLTVAQNSNLIFRLGSGASGSETVLAYGRVRTTTSEQISSDFGQYPFYYCGNIPAGTRIAIQKNNAENLDVVVIGIPYA